MSTPQQQPTAAMEVAQKTSPLITELAQRWGMQPKSMIDTLKATVFPQKDRNNNPVQVSNEQMIAFLQVANEYKLNPFLKELYAFPTKGGGIVPMVPIDGWANIVNRHPQYDGVEFVDDWFVPEGKQKHERSLFSTTCILHRKDRTHPTKVTEYMQECYDGNKEPWKKWPARMLRHKAFIQSARIAFSLAGIYDPDEAERIAAGEAHDDKPRLIERPKTVIEGVTLSTGQTSAPPTAAQAAQTDTAVQGGGSGQADARTASAENTPATQESGEPAASSTAPADSGTPQPTAAELFPARAEDKTQVDYATADQLKKLFVVAKATWGKDDYEKKLHEFLDFEYGIKSLKQVPVAKRDEIVDRVSKEISKQKK